MAQERAYRLSEISRRITQIIAGDEYLQGAWITAETVDVRISGGHCYLELVEKDAQGKVIARARATIWASVYRMLSAKFAAETGQQFRSDLKVMVYVQASYHPAYGLSLNISAINSAYTMGDAMRKRMQILEQLRKEGIADMNRTLPWPAAPQRVAIISASGAAGYGDFINQLCGNTMRLRFTPRLFPAVLQGDRAAASIIAALDSIAAQAESWDCVVIIRGGGATSDLAAFDDYALASAIAQFPIPVIVGIGHERDVTVLDYVANMRVKTPTAAAEWLVERGEQALGRLQAIGAGMLQALTDRMGGCHRQLAFLAGQLPAAAGTALIRAQKRLATMQGGISAISDRRLRPEQARLHGLAQTLAQAARFAADKAAQRLDTAAQLIAALSPEATLRRGYTITRAGGKAVCAASQLAPGQQITTVFADGSITSTINP